MVDRATISVAEGAKSLFFWGGSHFISPINISLAIVSLCQRGFCASPVWNMSDLTVDKCVQIIHFVQPVKNANIPFDFLQRVLHCHACNDSHSVNIVLWSSTFFFFFIDVLNQSLWGGKQQVGAAIRNVMERVFLSSPWNPL